MNIIVIDGNLGSDPQTIQTSTGTSMCYFNLANNSGYGDKKKTNWMQIKCFGKTADNVLKYLSKGSTVLVRGEISRDSYTAKDGTKKESTSVNAQEVQFVKTSKKEELSEAAEVVESDYSNIPNFSDDEIPF